MQAPYPHPLHGKFNDLWPAFIGGKWTCAKETFRTGGHLPGDYSREVADCGFDEINLAVIEASNAARQIASLGFQDRQVFLSHWQSLLRSREKQIAHAITSETGKPIAHALFEVRIAADVISMVLEDLSRVMSSKEPHFSSQEPRRGPLLAVTKFQLQAADIAYKAAVAFASGFPVIFVAATEAPTVALILAKMWESAGAPSSSLQIVTTASLDALLDPICANTAIVHCTLPDTPTVAKWLSSSGLTNPRHVSFTLEPDLPHVVLNDAVIESSAASIVTSRFFDTAHCPVRVKAVYVQRDIAKRFAHAVCLEIGQRTHGNPYDAMTQVPRIPNHVEGAYIDKAIIDAVDTGAEVIAGGRRKGLDMLPTVICNVSIDALVMREDTFGPVIPIVIYDSVDDLSEIIGLLHAPCAAWIWTGQPHREDLFHHCQRFNRRYINEQHDPFSLWREIIINNSQDGFSWQLEALLALKGKQ